MNNTDQTIYSILLWTLPVLLTILGFIGALAVNALMTMSKDLGEIKINVREATAKHDALVDRVEKIEDKVFK